MAEMSGRGKLLYYQADAEAVRAYFKDREAGLCVKASLAFAPVTSTLENCALILGRWTACVRTVRMI